MPSTMLLQHSTGALPGQVPGNNEGGGGGGGGASPVGLLKSSVQPPMMTSRCLSSPTTPRLQGFIVNWCRFRNSHPILGSFHHVNHSKVLLGGRNKFFEEMLVTPIQYQEIKRLRHNPYVGGGYIRSHKTLFHDLHMGYWAKERMAAREQRKKHMVSEKVKRPRLSVSTPSSGASSALSPPSSRSKAGTRVPADSGSTPPHAAASSPMMAVSKNQNRPQTAEADFAPTARSGSGLTLGDAAQVSVNNKSTPAAATATTTTTTTTTTAQAYHSLAALVSPRYAKSSKASLLSSTTSRSAPFNRIVSRRVPAIIPDMMDVLGAEGEQKLPHDADDTSPRTRESLSVPASVLDLHHGKSRRFEDFYTFEKLPPMSVRVVPKVRAGSGGTAGAVGTVSTTLSPDTKVAETEAQRVRQLGTEAKSGSMVGRGAYSSVRVGTHISTGDRFAIKQISKRYLYSEEEREAIRREVRIHCSPELVHDNIVFLYDYFEDEKAFYLVLDHCEGGDLETYMRVNKRKGVTELQAQMLFQQLMKALAFLHDQNIIHGDLKPQNVLLSKKPFAVVKICDFGNARYAKDVRYFSQTGSVSKVPYTSIMGTQGYIAPEILAKQHYGTEIDMWAAGIMCFVMLGGYKPFNPPSACLSCKTGADFNDPVWNEYSDACKDFITKLLRRDPAKRMTAADARTHPWIVGL